MERLQYTKHFTTIGHSCKKRGWPVNIGDSYNKRGAYHGTSAPQNVSRVLGNGHSCKNVGGGLPSAHEKLYATNLILQKFYDSQYSIYLRARSQSTFSEALPQVNKQHFKQKFCICGPYKIQHNLPSAQLFSLKNHSTTSLPNLVVNNFTLVAGVCVWQGCVSGMPIHSSNSVLLKNHLNLRARGQAST